MRRIEQQRFTILEVAADWHELMVPRRSMQPSTAHHDSGQVDPWRSTTDIRPPQSAALGIHSVACKRHYTFFSVNLCLQFPFNNNNNNNNTTSPAPWKRNVWSDRRLLSVSCRLLSRPATTTDAVPSIPHAYMVHLTEQPQI